MTSFCKNLDTLLEDEEMAVVYLKRYFFGDDTTNKYAGHAFNSLKPFDPIKITAEDLCAVSLLSVRINYSIVQGILLDNDFQSSATKLLDDMPDIDIWDEKDEFIAAKKLWKKLTEIEDIGPAIAGKILSRKRPKLIPVYDSKVDALLNPGEGKYWASFKAALSDDSNRRVEILTNIRKSAGLDEISILRTIDVIAWMTAMNPKNERGK